MREMMRFCWKSLSETDREGNRKAEWILFIRPENHNLNEKIKKNLPNKENKGISMSSI
jgi:hypothetical protein